MSKKNDEGIKEEEKSDDEIQKELAKKEDRKRKSDKLWKEIQAGESGNLITRVAHMLNRYPETRNSDLTLQIKYWQTYDNVTSDDAIKFKDLYQAVRLTSISRARAKIQNEYQLFRANDKIRQRRKSLEEEEKESQLLDKPSYSSLQVFSDETGKTGKYVFVAGIWFLDERTNPKIMRNFLAWSREKEKAGVKIPGEFHFRNLSNKNYDELNLYKEFFDLIIQSGEMISFKATGVNQTKINKMSITDLIVKLYYQFIRLGAEHEINSERIKLPRKINLTKDQDGESELVIENIKQELRDNFKLNHEDQLVMDQLILAESDKNIFLQFADLFAASINRKYNNPGNNNKDKLADYILKAVNLNNIDFTANKVDEMDLENPKKSDQSVLFLFD